ncbi:hypothetical protein L3X38_045474 [Prunus dulcis]|uniref:Uncharacterized protein n=1 Tax=Prunus dulcis TaxID=3755 RepID=A0AAD4US38_PRUDU|nr:hypothetical protein L3X38_040724 [Prunus dulcis]KAI5310947.1 hypothetical protein L3X38_045470 [Prunus dulcis]KAI5310951.1 hypothetical protein L3X38_045474 [Prunus dulcis]
MDQLKTNETLKLFYSHGRKILPCHIDDNLRYLGDLKRVLAFDASISFAVSCGYSVDLRCQLPDEGVQHTNVGGDCEKKPIDAYDYSETTYLNMENISRTHLRSFLVVFHLLKQGVIEYKMQIRVMKNSRFMSKIGMTNSLMKMIANISM